ncbi:MAG: multidrug efflux RND transporter permease subunit [Myxococcota bacterium]
MNLSHFFIRRPIFAGVIWILVMILGGVAVTGLPVAQYPEVAPPTIQVTASYPGASAETIAESVATPLEEEINGVEGMLYITSQSTAAGQATIQVTFEPGVDLDTAQVLVQNRVALAEPRLPEPVRRLGLSTVKSNPDALLVVHLFSPDESRDQLYISNYARLNLRDRLQRIEGVGQIQMFGLREYSMRVWIDPERAGSLDLTAGEVVAALRARNVEVAGGGLGRPPTAQPGAFEVSLQLGGRLSSVDEFERVVVKTTADGRQVRLRDVAEVELGAQDYSTNARLDGAPALAMLFNQQPGSNALDTAERILATMEDVSADLPAGLTYDVVWNPTEFVSASIGEIQKTILEAILLVSIIVFLFLQSLRASIIPIVAIPISLVGTFAVMAGFGFSLNMLSLFGLVLAIGIVVDDAIVVVENVERKMHEGLSPMDAAHATMDEVGGALVSIALVLSAVFIPTAFLEGISGQFFRQFAVTVAAATIISAAVSLTLSPALAARLLKPPTDAAPRRWWDRATQALFDRFNRGFDAAARGYGSVVRRLLRVPALVLAVYAGLLALTGHTLNIAPKGFVPATDQNYLITVIQLPPGASLDRTEAVMEEVAAAGLEHPEVAHAVAFAGLDGATRTTASNAAAVFFTTEDIHERNARGFDAPRVLADLRQRFADRQDAFVLVIPPPPVRGIGQAGGFKGYVQDRSGRGYEALAAEAQRLAGASNGDPAVASAFATFNTRTPQLFADVDTDKAQRLGVSVAQLYQTLEVYLGSAYVNDFTAFGRPFRVTAQAGAEHRRTPADVARLRTRNADGDMVPVGSVARFEDRTGPNRVARYNLYPAAAVQGDVAAGASSDQALGAVETAAAPATARGFGFEWTELALQQRSAGNTAAIAFGLAVVFVFLLLAAQYESLTLPLAVVLIVPMTLLSSVLGVLAMSLDVDILVQVGFVVLVGLAAKNAILIVEFAKQAEDRGLSRTEAAVEAARLRLRPIVMTSLAFILGVVPMMLASGAGHELLRSLGTAVFFGMLGVTVFGLLLTPVFFVVTGAAGAWLGRRLRAKNTGGALPAAAGLLALLVSACTVGPDYRAPEAPVAAAETTLDTDDAVETYDAEPAHDWWQALGDDRLDGLVERALEESREIQRAAARVDAAMALLDLEETKLRPSGGVDASYQRRRVPGAGFGADEPLVAGADYLEVGLRAGWELDLVGRVRRLTEAALADAQATEHLRRGAHVVVAAETTRAYILYRGVARELAVARRNLAQQRDTAALTATRVAEGYGSALDAERADAQRHRTEAALAPLEATLAAMVNRLATLTGGSGLEIAAYLEEKGAKEDLHPPRALPVGDVSGLLRRRPDVRAAERRLAAATARIGVATAEYFPRVRLSGALGLQAQSLAGLGSGNAVGYGIGPSLSWSGFDVGRVGALVDQADHTAAGARAEYEQTVLEALEETRTAVSAYGRQVVRLRALRQAADRVARATELARIRYDAGAEDFLSVLQAQGAQLDVERALTEAQTAMALRYVAVYRALGAGWRPREMAKTTAPSRGR